MADSSQTPPGASKPSGSGGSAVLKGAGYAAPTVIAIRSASYDPSSSTLTVSGTTVTIQTGTLNCYIYKDADGSQVPVPPSVDDSGTTIGMSEQAGPRGATPGHWTFTFLGSLSPDIIVVVTNDVPVNPSVDQISDKRYVDFPSGS